MLNRINKVGGRFREINGKPFNKISEKKLANEELINELQNSVNEVAKGKTKSSLQQQKLESTLIKLKRDTKLIK